MTFEEKVAELNADGWLINNCFQQDDGIWRASLRHATKEEYSAFSPGKTPLDAVTLATKTILIDDPVEDPDLDSLLG